MDKQSILGSRKVHVNYSYRETGPGNAQTQDFGNFKAHDTFDDGEHYAGDRRCKMTYNNGRKTKSYNTKRYKPYYFVDHYDRWGRQTLYYSNY